MPQSPLQSLKAAVKTCSPLSSKTAVKAPAHSSLLFLTPDPPPPAPCFPLCPPWRGGCSWSWEL